MRAGILLCLLAAPSHPALSAGGGTEPPPAQPLRDTVAGYLGGAAEAAGTAAYYAYTGTAGVLSSAVNGVSAVYSGVGQALYETSYMIGVNRTPLAREEYVDRPAARPAALSKTTPGEADVAAVPSPIPAAAPVRPSAPPPPEPPAAEPAAPAPVLQPMDPGLLANLVYDRSSRNADGSFFVPKTLQRMFEVRTERVAATEVRAVLRLNGRIVPDPQAHGQVQAGVLGRIEPPETGMPVLGDTVRKGQVLGYVVPAVSMVDRSQVRREIARLTHEIRVTAESLEMTKQFSFVPFREGKIIQLEIKLDGLRQERAALLPMLKTQEALRAPIDGVIATSTAVAGRVTQPGETVFEIVNPKMLWVEVTVPDPTVAAEVERGAQASARTPEGQSLAVTYVGSGPAVRQQSTPMLFRIDNPPHGLRVGRPVSVLMQSDHASQRGLPVRRAALTVGADGIQQVWEQTDAETFVSHAIQTQDIDAQTVLVLNGLTEGARVVVRGVSLMTQLQ